jgi:hypothetical protein
VFHGADDPPLVAGAALVAHKFILFRPSHCSLLKFKGAEGMGRRAWGLIRHYYY